MKNNLISPFAALSAWRTMLFEGEDEGGSGGGGENTGESEMKTDEGAGADEGKKSAEDTGKKNEGSLLGDGKGDDEGGEGDKGEATPPEPVTLEQLELPEGFTIPDDVQQPFLDVVNNQDLSRTEMVNELIKLQAQASDSASESLWTQQQEAWKQETQALPEIGGANLDQSLADIKRGLDAAGATKEVYQALDVTGAGNNPHIIQLMHKLTKPFREGGPVSGAPSQGTVDRAARMYPTMQNKE